MMKLLYAVEICTTKISPNFFVHAPLENFIVYQKKCQCITIHQRVLPLSICGLQCTILVDIFTYLTFITFFLLDFFHVLLLSSCTFSCGTLFLFHFGQVTFFSVLNLFHVAFFHIAFLLCCTFTCCKFFMLH